MVAPLIIGAARVVAGKKTAQVVNVTKRKRTKAEFQTAIQNEKGEYRGRNSIPGLKSKKNERQGDVNKQRTKAQVLKNLTHLMREELFESSERMSEEETENFLRFVEENLDSMRSSGDQNDKQSIFQSALTAYRTFKAARASWFIFWSACGFIIPQLTFGIIGLIGFGVEENWIVGSLLPGESVFIASWFIAAIIGIITMIYALLSYLGNLVNCLSGMKFLVFALCIGAYLIPLPLLNAFPWFLLWLWVVTSTQGKSASSE